MVVFGGFREVFGEDYFVLSMNLLYFLLSLAPLDNNLCVQIKNNWKNSQYYVPIFHQILLLLEELSLLALGCLL